LQFFFLYVIIILVKKEKDMKKIIIAIIAILIISGNKSCFCSLDPFGGGGAEITPGAGSELTSDGDGTAHPLLDEGTIDSAGSSEGDSDGISPEGITDPAEGTSPVSPSEPVVEEVRREETGAGGLGLDLDSDITNPQPAGDMEDVSPQPAVVEEVTAGNNPGEQTANGNAQSPVETITDATLSAQDAGTEGPPTPADVSGGEPVSGFSGEDLPVMGEGRDGVQEERRDIHANAGTHADEGEQVTAGDEGMNISTSVGESDREVNNDKYKNIGEHPEEAEDNQEQHETGSDSTDQSELPHSHYAQQVSNACDKQLREGKTPTETATAIAGAAYNADPVRYEENIEDYLHSNSVSTRAGVASATPKIAEDHGGPFHEDDPPEIISSLADRLVMHTPWQYGYPVTDREEDEDKPKTGIIMQGVRDANRSLYGGVYVPNLPERFGNFLADDNNYPSFPYITTVVGDYPEDKKKLFFEFAVKGVIDTAKGDPNLGMAAARGLGNLAAHFPPDDIKELFYEFMRQLYYQGLAGDGIPPQIAQQLMNEFLNGLGKKIFPPLPGVESSLSGGFQETPQGIIELRELLVESSPSGGFQRNRSVLSYHGGCGGYADSLGYGGFGGRNIGSIREGVLGSREGDEEDLLSGFSSGEESTEEEMGNTSLTIPGKDSLTYSGYTGLTESENSHQKQGSGRIGREELEHILSLLGMRNGGLSSEAVEAYLRGVCSSNLGEIPLLEGNFSDYYHQLLVENAILNYIQAMYQDLEHLANLEDYLSFWEQFWDLYSPQAIIREILKKLNPRKLTRQSAKLKLIFPEEISPIQLMVILLSIIVFALALGYSAARYHLSRRKEFLTIPISK